MDPALTKSAILAPISLIPNEILSTIFEFACLNASPFEMILSQVTYRFRNVALNTPQLWITIHSSLLDLYKSYDKVIAYLCRSGALPLDLRLTVPADENRLSEMCLQTINALGRHIARWRRLEVDAGRSTFNLLPYFFRELPSTPAYLLEYAKISEIHDGYVDQYYDLFPGGAPSLTTLLVQGIGNNVPLLTSLTTLRLYNPLGSLRRTLGYLSGMLKASPALSHLIICGDLVDTRSWDRHDTHIHMRNLRHLHICAGGQTSVHFPNLLSKISAPALKTLILEMVVPQEIQSHFWRATPDKPKFPSLTSLTLLPPGGFVFDSHTWQLLYQMSPAVSHLSMSHNALDGFLKSFCQHDAGSVYPWPDLDTLTFINHLLNNELRELITLVESRIGAGFPIRRLQLAKGIQVDPLPEALSAQLRALLHLDEECTNYPIDLNDGLVPWTAAGEMRCAITSASFRSKLPFRPHLQYVEYEHHRDSVIHYRRSTPRVEKLAVICSTIWR